MVSVDANPLCESAYPTRAVAWYATFVLAMLYWLSVLDRFIVSLLVDPIKRDMGLTDMQFGMLHGIGFALTYAVLGLIAGAAQYFFDGTNTAIGSGMGVVIGVIGPICAVLLFLGLPAMRAAMADAERTQPAS